MNMQQIAVMTVGEAAEYLGTTAQKLVNDLQRKKPEIKWTASSQIPDDLVQKIESAAGEYRQEATPQIGGKLTTAEATQLTQESIEYAILEALDDYQLPILNYSGQVQAAREIQAFEEGRADVWAAYCQSQSALANGQLERAEKLAKDFLPGALAKQALKVQLANQAISIHSRISSLPKLH